jgi:hypothetical protein
VLSKFRFFAIFIIHFEQRAPLFTKWFSKISQFYTKHHPYHTHLQSGPHLQGLHLHPEPVETFLPQQDPTVSLGTGNSVQVLATSL